MPLSARTLGGALLVALLLTVAPTVPARAAAGHVPHAYFGLHDGSQEAYRHLDVGSLRLWDAGVTWADLEVAPGVFDWTRLDDLVRAAQQHHTQVTLVLAMTPSFYGPGSSEPPTRMRHYRDFVRAVMLRYRSFDGRRGIAAYQVWNEGNVPYFWSSTPRQLAVLTRVVWRVHQQVDPDATIVAPSFAVRLRSQRRWLAAYESQRVERTTGVALLRRQRAQPLPAGYVRRADRWPRGRDAAPRDGPASARPGRRTSLDAGVGHRGQLRRHGADHPPAAPVAERRQVANVIRTYLLGAARGLGRLFWYRYDWNTLPASQGGGTLGNTLLSVPGSPDQITPAGEAFATAQHWLQGTLLATHGHRPCYRDDRRAPTPASCGTPAGRRTIFWNPDHQVRVPVPRDAQTLQTSRGASSALSGHKASLRVFYLPVMVVSPQLNSRLGYGVRARSRPSTRGARRARTSRSPWSSTWNANGSDLGHPAGPDRAAGQGREEGERHRTDQAGADPAQSGVVPAGGRVAHQCAVDSDRGDQRRQREQGERPSRESGRCRAAPPAAGTAGAGRAPPRSG